MKNLKLYAMVLILFFCFCLNVHAETTPLSDVIFNKPSDTTIKTYSNYFVSNVYNSDNDEIDIGWLSGSTSDDDNLVRYFNNSLETITRDSKFRYNENVEIPGNYSVKHLDFKFNGNYFPLEFGKKYSVLFRLTKSKDVTYHRTKTLDFEKKEENEEFKLKFGRVGYSNKYDVEDCIKDFYAYFHVIPDENDTSQKSNVAYLLFEFELDKDSFIHDTNGSYYLNELNIYNVPFLIGSIDESITGNWKVSSIGYFQDTQITFAGPGSGSSGGGHTSGGGYHDDLDKVRESDVILFDNYEICSDGDIFCYIKNIFQSIKNFFVRVGNFFYDFFVRLGNLIKNLFIPDEDFFTSHFKALNKGLHVKLGLLTYPLDLLFNVFDRFNNLSNSSNGVINIPNIDVPGFGNLVKSRTFKINEYWSQEPFSTLYNIYLAFVHCFIGFCLYKLALRKEEEIIGGVYSR